MITTIVFTLYVANQEKSRDFYTNFLQIEPSLDQPDMTEFILQPNVKIGLMNYQAASKIVENKMPDPASGEGIPRCEILMRLDEAQPYIDRAVQMGAKMISPLHESGWGDLVAYLADQDGNILGLAETPA